jgi:dipeptidyl aminopeptidase/acylaminoacyl peptidase
MKRIRLSALLALLAACALFAPLAAQNAPKRPLEVTDILAFKSLGQSALSNDGQWLAYRMAPQQGDASVIVRATTGDKEMKFPIGEGAGTFTFSDDSAWIAIATSATKKEADAARRASRTLQNGMTLVNLATGEKTDIAKIRRFVFSGEMGGWIALHRYAPDGGGAAGGGARGAAPAGGGRGAGAGAAGGTPSTAPKGTDLVLHDLKSGAELNFGNVSEFGFNKSGKILAMVIDAADQAGNGIQLRDMATGAITPLEGDKAFYERISWTDDGDAMAIMKGHDDKAWKERLYAIVAFTGFNNLSGGAPKKIVFDPSKDKSLPADMAISANRSPQWTESRDAVLFGIAPLTKVERPAAGAGRAGGGADQAAGDAPAQTPPAGGAAAAPDPTDRPDLIIWHYKDPRLQSQQQVQEASDKAFNYLSIYRVAENKFIRLATDDMRSVAPQAKEKWAIGTDTRGYELEGATTGRNYRDVYSVNMMTGDRKLIKKQLRFSEGGSPDGSKWMYYENKNFFVHDLATGEAKNITAGLPFSVVDTEDDHNVVDPPRGTMGWTSDSAAVLVTDGWDIYTVPAAGGAAVNLTVNGKKDAIRYRGRVRIDPDEKGIDLSKPQYFSAMAEWTKKQGYVLLEPGRPGTKPLVWGDASSSRLAKAKKADVWIYSSETPNHTPEIYATNAMLENGRKLTNTQVEVEPFAWTSGSMLIDFTNDYKDPARKVKPEHLQASLHLPANYEKGKTYPMVVYIYERLTQSHNAFVRPNVPGTGFNIAYYTSNGYAVLEPDIKYYVNDPGMSAVWAIVPAVKAAIATGVVDPQRVALHGHSWGGYQTAFTVTQTDIFKAAVAGAPLTDMISMYSLIYKNSGGTNGAIFESSQGRFTGPPLEIWDAYTRNSPVRYAANVKTPLIILSNDKDGAVDFTQGIEYYDTLRRMGKPVVLLEYPGENHGLAKLPNMQDYMVRMKEFFDHYLMAQPAPEWLANGIPLLKMQDHITERLKQQQNKEKKTDTTTPVKKGGGG